MGDANSARPPRCYRPGAVGTSAPAPAIERSVAAQSSAPATQRRGTRMASTNSVTRGLARRPAAWMSLDTGSARGRGFRVADEEGAVMNAGLPSEDARMIAERAHRGQIEPSGRPYIDHVRRVAAKPCRPRRRAWPGSTTSSNGRSSPKTTPRLPASPRRSGRRCASSPAAAGTTTIDSSRTCGSSRRPRRRRPDRPRRQARRHGGPHANARDPGAAWRPPYRRALELLEREGADR